MGALLFVTAAAWQAGGQRQELEETTLQALLFAAPSLPGNSAVVTKHKMANGEVHYCVSTENNQVRSFHDVAFKHVVALSTNLNGELWFVSGPASAARNDNKQRAEVLRKMFADDRLKWWLKGDFFVSTTGMPETNGEYTVIIGRLTGKVGDNQLVKLDKSLKVTEIIGGW